MIHPNQKLALFSLFFSQVLETLPSEITQYYLALILVPPEPKSTQLKKSIEVGHICVRSSCKRGRYCLLIKSLAIRRGQNQSLVNQALLGDRSVAG